MPNILILGGGAAGLAAALAAAQSAPAAQVIVLERNPKPGKSCLPPAMAAAIWITPALHRSCISLPTRQHFVRCWMP